MRVFVFVNNPYKLENPYVSTLLEGISKVDSSVEWGYGLLNFWSDTIFDYDIIHVHWPDMILASITGEDKIERIYRRICEIKEHGVKLIATCHNIEAHYAKDKDTVEVYPLIYSFADVIIHLGEYSLKFMRDKYAQAKHVIIYHHTYDTLYHRASREESISKLGLSPDKRYILCFGAFRDNEERNLVDKVLREVRKEGCEILAPNYYKIIKRKNILLMIKQWLRCKWKSFSTPGLHINGRYVDDEQLPYYFGASDLSLIQRKKILNSGNIPMAFLMGNVVVGPDTGNVGEMLKKTGNPVFNPEEEDSVVVAVKEGLKLSSKGEENKQFAKDKFASRIISEQILKIYENITV